MLVCEPSGHETILCVCDRASTEFRKQHTSGKKFCHFRLIFSHLSVCLNKKMFYTKVMRDLVQNTITKIQTCSFIQILAIISFVNNV